SDSVEHFALGRSPRDRATRIEKGYAMGGRRFLASCCVGIMFCLAAAPALSGVPGEAQTAAALIRELTDKDAAVRLLAARALGHHAAEADKVAPALRVALKDKHPAVRWRAAKSLGHIAPAAGKTIEALIAASNDPQMDVRICAWEALGRIGIVDQGTGLLLIRAFGRSMKTEVESAAIKAMAAIGKPAIPLLTTALKHEKAQVRTRAVEALALMGHKAKRALPALVAALTDDNGNVMVAAAKALAQIGPEGVAELIRRLKTDGGGVQMAAAYALLNADRPPTEALAALTSALTRGGPHTRGYAARTLARFGRSAEPALDALVKALSDKEHKVRGGAAEALAAIGPKAVGPLLKPLKLNWGRPPSSKSKRIFRWRMNLLGPQKCSSGL
ncbi:hypothetical protein LCGC14_0458320, partial [marine sediment metagenome]